MGLVGAMEALADAAKRFQEFEDYYRTSQAVFSQMQQQFQQMQDGATHLQAITEERLTALDVLNVELKVRHSQGEQSLKDVQALLEEVKARQAEWDQNRASAEMRNQYDGEAAAQVAQTLGVVQGLVEQLQGQQAQLGNTLAAIQAQWEQRLGSAEAQWQSAQAQWQGGAEKSQEEAGALAALQASVDKLTERQKQVDESTTALRALMEEQGQRYVDHEKILGGVRSLCHQVADRQAQVEKTATILQATVDAEKGLIGHFEKSLDAVRSMAAEMRKRQAENEVALNTLKANGAGENGAPGDRTSSAPQGMTEEVQRAVAAASERLAAMEKKWVKAVEAAESARHLAAKALEQAATAPPAVAVPMAEMSPDDQKKASGDFQQFLTRCQNDHKTAMEQQSKLQTQMKMELDKLPSRAEQSIQKLLEQGKHHLEQTWNNWVQHREQRVVDLEGRYNEMVERVIQANQHLEKEMEKTKGAGGAPQPQPAAVAGRMRSLEATTHSHTAELRFMKTLVWVALAGIGVAYAVVAYVAFAVRSSPS